ncbi:hypothetical protein [Burkholderia arboris]|uniref:hypothetical protein n=1 Tax=Burkholderia arboris TaxID=488730 RepID=UPI00158C3E53|nr:hypothetical protein [Burkholderia arboris]
MSQQQPYRFPEALATLLQEHGWDSEMQHMRECEITIAVNRSVVGTVDEFALLRTSGKKSKIHLRIYITSP